MNVNISVALAIYNGGRYLKEQLQSIVSQELLPAEIVIVDDVSVDNSENIIQNFDFGGINCRYYKNESNLGPVANFKKAIGLCASEFVALCDQDDIWLPKKLKILYENILDRNQLKPVVSFSDVSLMDSRGNLLAKSIYKDVWKIKPHKYSFRLLLIDNVVIGCTIMINKKMQEMVLKMPVDGITMHDHWIALIGITFGEFNLIDEPLILYRSHETSVTQKFHVSSPFKTMKNRYINRKDYLTKNFEQAEKFKKAYYSEMDASDKKTLDYFITIKKWPFMAKFMYARLLNRYTNL